MEPKWQGRAPRFDSSVQQWWQWKRELRHREIDSLAHKRRHGRDQRATACRSSAGVQDATKRVSWRLLACSNEPEEEAYTSRALKCVAIYCPHEAGYSSSLVPVSVTIKSLVHVLVAPKLLLRYCNDCCA